MAINIAAPLLLKVQKLFRVQLERLLDIVEKEMYTWKDTSGDSLTLRPEGTAGVVRMMIEHNLPREGIQKVFYKWPNV